MSDHVITRNMKIQEMSIGYSLILVMGGHWQFAVALVVSF